MIYLFEVIIGDKFTLGEGGQGIRGAVGYRTIGEFISTVIPNVLIAANIILFFFILFGGFTLISSAGNPDKQAEGAKILTYSLIGFLIIFGAYWLMGILNIITGFDLLNSTL